MKSSGGQLLKNLLSSTRLTTLVKRFSKPKAKYACPSPSELPRFMESLTNASIRLETRMLIEWQLLTWVRPVEAVRARWSDIDTNQQHLNIPADFMQEMKSFTKFL